MLAWYSMLTLMADALEILDARLRVAAGTSKAEEKFLMVTEDFGGTPGTRAVFIRGDCGEVLDRYRKIIGNIERSPTP